MRAHRCDAFQLAGTIVGGGFHDDAVAMLPGLGQNILGEFGEIHLPQIGNDQLEQPGTPGTQVSGRRVDFVSEPVDGFRNTRGHRLAHIWLFVQKIRHRGYRNTGLMGHVRHRHSVFASHGDHPTRLCWRYENDSPAAMSSKRAVE